MKGIGPERAQALQREGLATVEDLLYRLPMRYEDRRRLTRIADLKPGLVTSVSGRVAAAGLRRTRRMPLYEILLEDGSGRLKAVWFNQPYLRDVLTRGSLVPSSWSLMLSNPSTDSSTRENGKSVPK